MRGKTGLKRCFGQALGDASVWKIPSPRRWQDGQVAAFAGEGKDAFVAAVRALESVETGSEVTATEEGFDNGRGGGAGRDIRCIGISFISFSNP